MSKIDTISKDMGDEFLAIAMTTESQEKIVKFLKEKELNVWTTVNDTIFKAAFPRNSIPHEIWIKDNKVFGITDAEQIEDDIVRRVMDGEITSLPEKTFNSSYDRSIPLLVDGNGGTASDMLYHSLITGYLDGIGGGGVDEVLPDRYRLRILNSLPVQMYRSVSGRVDPVFWDRNRLIIRGVDRDSLLSLSASFPSDREHFYSYELIVPMELKPDVPDIAFTELNRFFGIKYGLQAVITPLITECWIMSVSNKQLLPIEKGEQTRLVFEERDTIHFKNTDINSYVRGLSSAFSRITHPIIDETEINEKIDISYIRGEGGFEKTREMLRGQGIELTLEKRTIDMLLITSEKHEGGEL